MQTQQLSLRDLYKSVCEAVLWMQNKNSVSLKLLQLLSLVGFSNEKERIPEAKTELEQPSEIDSSDEESEDSNNDEEPKNDERPDVIIFVF